MKSASAFVCCSAPSFASRPSRSVAVCTISPPRPTAPTVAPNERSRIATVQPTADGKAVDVRFADDADTIYRFHSVWLRDACRDDAHVVSGGVGERILTATPVAGTCELADLAAVHGSVSPAADAVTIAWNDASPTPRSTFDASFLRDYAGIVAKPLPTPGAVNGAPRTLEQPTEHLTAWLKPYTGFPDAPAPAADDISLWTNEGAGADVAFPRFAHDDVLDKPDANLELLQQLHETGVALIDGVPPPTDDDSGSSLKFFMDRAFGGLQKDHARDEPNWQITRKEGATSISYDHDKRLNGHTDQSVPPHGLPGVVLSMHYVTGHGVNTLVDGFAVGAHMQAEYPEMFELLTRHAYDAERDFIGSRVDSEQVHYKSLVVSRKNRVFQTDAADRLTKIMYNEVFRVPLTLPYDVLPRYIEALDVFARLVHDPRFERRLPMKAGTMLLMNNWRVLHGRAGGMAAPSRKLVGGTITRESFFSKARMLIKQVHQCELPFYT